MFHDVQAPVDFTTQFKRMKIATKEDRFARRAQFSAGFGDDMLYIADVKHLQMASQMYQEAEKLIEV